MKGQLSGEAHPRARLTDKQCAEMRHIRERSGATYAALAKRFNCGETTARDITNYYTRF